jgi:hypothetical protein
METVFRIPQDAELPLVGCITFGLIDRGTNLIQVRPISGCNLNCIFCSVDEGPKTKMHVTSYVVDLDYLMEWFAELAKLKGEVEAHIDGCGEPLLYPKFAELVSSLSDVKEVKTISVQTNGTLLDESKVDELAGAGLNRINLSINAMDAEMAKKLSGSAAYDIERIKEIAKCIAKSKIELLIAPVFIPGMNDNEMLPIIKFAKELGCGRVWPSLGIQNFEAHRFGRKPKSAEKLTWWKFYRMLEQLEKQSGMKLKLTAKDFGIHKAPSLQTVFERGDKIRAIVKAPGWMKNEMIAVAKDRCITVFDCDNDIGDEVRIKILENKHNIYIAEKAK